MAEAFRERERAKPPERVLPSIAREQREVHGPLDVIGRSAAHLRIPAESTRPGGAKAVAKSDLDMRIARNVSTLRLEGSEPLHSRFMRLLDSLLG
ncbi:MAG TPA: hypothetical protein VLD37_06260 [Candidatus Bilamarchaeum sp.]|nr:hypothetical protein [Candidatus Bilamarchaeum sp.]